MGYITTSRLYNPHLTLIAHSIPHIRYIICNLILSKQIDIVSQHEYAYLLLTNTAIGTKLLK